MSALYLDSSAFIKVVVEEPESDALRAFLAGEHGRYVSSVLTRTEAMRAVRYIGSEARARVREALRRIDLVSIDDRVLDAAGLLDPDVLRSLDAIHVATALALGDDLDVVVTYDEHMIRTASLMGIPTATPRPPDVLDEVVAAIPARPEAEVDAELAEMRRVRRRATRRQS